MSSMLSQIARQGELNFPHFKTLRVAWLLTEMCNYSCSYCFGQLPVGSRPFSTWSQLLHAVDVIDSLNRPQVHFDLGGGELSLHPELPKLVEEIHRRWSGRSYSIHCLSNGSRSVSFYEKLVTGKSGQMGLSFSVHTEYASIEHFSRLVEALAEKCSLTIKLMFHPEKREMVERFFERFLELREHYSFGFVIPLLREAPRFNQTDPRYTEEDFTWWESAKRKIQAGVPERSNHESSSHEAESTGLENAILWDIVDQSGIVRRIRRKNDFEHNLMEGYHNLQDMWCCMGTRVLEIGPTGFCKGAQCPAAIGSSVSIYEGDPFSSGELPGVILCPDIACGCPANDCIPKYRNLDEALAVVNTVSGHSVHKAAQTLSRDCPKCGTIVIWGTGGRFRDVWAQHFPGMKESCLGFVDNNPQAHGGVFEGLPVYRPENVPWEEVDQVVIASHWKEDIRAQLKQLGYTGGVVWR